MRLEITLPRTRIRVAVILGLVFGLICTASAQNTEKAKPGQAASKPSGGQQEGIKVHGQWTIVVREPDGKEVERREFNNALLDSGKSLLGLLLTRRADAGEWAIQVLTAGVRQCTVLLEPRPALPVTEANLTVNFVEVTRTIELRGFSTNTTAFDCDVARVETHLNFTPFTGTDLTPFRVARGRIIEVTVVLSFS
jgi:hypothetical protein